jgi:hypothetical protein
MRKCCRGARITLRAEVSKSFLTGNEENPELVLSNVHNRTSARDGPMFGSMGLSMYTTSLVHTRRAERGMGGQYFGRREK